MSKGGTLPQSRIRTMAEVWRFRIVTIYAIVFCMDCVVFFCYPSNCALQNLDLMQPHLGANRETFQVLKDQGLPFCKNPAALSGHRCLASASSGIVEQSSSQRYHQLILFFAQYSNLSFIYLYIMMVMVSIQLQKCCLMQPHAAS